MHKCPCINVLCIAMHKWWNKLQMGDGENWTIGKVRKTELTENWCLPFFECRKVTTQKCFKHSHASMLKQNLGWLREKIEPIEKFENWINICFSGFPSAEYQHQPLWKNWKMAAISLISIVQKNFQLLTPTKFGSLVFRVSTEMEYQHWPLWKNWKMAAISLISIAQKIFYYWPPPKFGSPVFQVLMETEYQGQPLWKNWKMVAISLILIIWKNFQLQTPSKFGSPVFQVSMETEYQSQPLWKNWKMAATSLISIIWKNFELLTPQSLGLQFSECWQKRNIIRKPEMQIFFFLNFPLVHFFPSPILGSISTFMHGHT